MITTRQPRRRIAAYLPLIVAMLATALLAPMPAVVAAPVTGSNVVTFGTQTATASAPDGRGYYSFGATPGGRILDHIAVVNYSKQAISLLVRPVDAVNTPQGGFAALPVDDRSKDVGTWIALPPSELIVTLKPRSDVIIPFEVEVPRTAVPGDHFGVLTATLESSVISKSGQRLHLLQTVGTRVFVRVSGPLHPAFRITNLRVGYEGTLDPIGRGKAVLSYTVRNVGNVALGGRQTVSVSGLFGSRRVATHVADIQLLLPGYSVKRTVSISGIIPEILDSGRVSISPLIIPGTVQPASEPYRASVSFWAVPWTLLGIVAFLLLLAVGVLLRRRRRRKGAGTRTGGPSKPDPGDGRSRDHEVPGADTHLITPHPVGGEPAVGRPATRVADDVERM